VKFVLELTEIESNRAKGQTQFFVIQGPLLFIQMTGTMRTVVLLGADKH
jgi:hypothetical protein